MRVIFSDDDKKNWDIGKKGYYGDRLWLFFNLDCRKLDRLDPFLRHEPLGKRFDLCTIAMH